ncbi:MAG TPA: sortase [Candidatus Saccharibacteria bacterium]|jgi:sortase A|nr:sortase [Candidatus Saccharibacteria bacterium]HMR37997.1 sortase [Candidatus Saccharibacteria bacterium]
MLTLKQSQKFPWQLIVLAVAVLLLAGGIYMLASTSSPFIARQFTDPANNATTKLIEETKDTINENRLYIPKIDINLPYAAGDENTMLKGAWWRKPENGNPKDGGNFVLSAHRFVMGWTPGETVKRSPFYNIDKLAIGDEITIDYQKERFVFVIEKTYSVKPDAVEIENRTDDTRLTLYSCTLGGASDGRDVIIAKLRATD